MDIKKALFLGLGASALYALKTLFDDDKEEEQEIDEDLDRLIFVLRDNLTQVMQHAFSMADFKIRMRQEQETRNANRILSPDDVTMLEKEEQHLNQQFAIMRTSWTKVVLKKHDVDMAEFNTLLDTYETESTVAFLLSQIDKIS